ncbi:hypothetical protein D046_8356A, partial [Vibrio parahaemolyticus V-223/04]
MSQTACRKS